MLHPLDNRFENFPSYIWSKIIQIDEFKGHWIEGAKLSDEDIEKLMRGISIQTEVC